MFDFFKKKSRDDINSVEFLNIILEKGPKTRLYINDVLQMDKENSIKINNGKILEIDMAILGTSLSILNGNSQVISKKRGKKIGGYCKSIVMNKITEEDYEFIKKGIIKKYEEAFQEAMTKNINPFEEISGILLVHCLEEQIDKICVPGTNYLNQFIHQSISDIMFMTITDVMKYWKDK